MVENETRRLQLTELQILRDVADFCDKNEIVYFLCGGTLLGAVRHQGFIPWDDDVDIIMDKKNYNKFLKYSKKLPNKYFVQNYKTEKKLCYPWTKVLLKGTTLIHSGMQHYDIRQNIYIDVFMINGIARGAIRSKIQRKMLKLKGQLLKKYYYIEVKNELPKGIVRLLPEFLRRPLITVTENISNIDISKSTQCVENEFCNLSMAKKYNSKDFYPENRVDLNFENYDFSCPKSYKTYLKVSYGDWQAIPPENERITHNNCIVDFEKDYKNYIQINKGK